MSHYDIRKRPRWLQRLRAFPAHFWLPCPLCGEEFGGHEWILDRCHDLPIDRGRTIATCPACPVESVSHPLRPTPSPTP